MLYGKSTVSIVIVFGRIRHSLNSSTSMKMIFSEYKKGDGNKSSGWTRARCGCQRVIVLSGPTYSSIFFPSLFKKTLAAGRTKIWQRTCPNNIGIFILAGKIRFSYGLSVHESKSSTNGIHQPTQKNDNSSISSPWPRYLIACLTAAIIV